MDRQVKAGAVERRQKKSPAFQRDLSCSLTGPANGPLFLFTQHLLRTGDTLTSLEQDL